METVTGYTRRQRHMQCGDDELQVPQVHVILAVGDGALVHALVGQAVYRVHVLGWT